ncbi:hypothetical protein F4Z99_19350 [Candidatus Poribacteria bacterium]|nr:hypothetical protein [Candidatus Poribacteria bacterium]MYA98641.1 hypothetical protein [Candidatus Poribacteria bacterium]
MPKRQGNNVAFGRCRNGLRFSVKKCYLGKSTGTAFSLSVSRQTEGAAVIGIACSVVVEQGGCAYAHCHRRATGSNALRDSVVASVRLDMTLWREGILFQTLD